MSRYIHILTNLRGAIKERVPFRKVTRPSRRRHVAAVARARWSAGARDIRPVQKPPQQKALAYRRTDVRRGRIPRACARFVARQKKMLVVYICLLRCVLYKLHKSNV